MADPTRDREVWMELGAVVSYTRLGDVVRDWSWNAELTNP
jgi:hypothetical protein